MSNNGAFCPEVEFAPLTAEGLAVAAALDRHGLWKRAGWAGVIAGLDMTEALASVPAECDVEVVRRLFMIAEFEFVSAHLEITKTDEDGNGH